MQEEKQEEESNGLVYDDDAGMYIPEICKGYGEVQKSIQERKVMVASVKPANKREEEVKRPIMQLLLVWIGNILGQVMVFGFIVVSIFFPIVFFIGKGKGKK